MPSCRGDPAVSAEVQTSSAVTSTANEAKRLKRSSLLRVATASTHAVVTSISSGTGPCLEVPVGAPIVFCPLAVSRCPFGGTALPSGRGDVAVSTKAQSSQLESVVREATLEEQALKRAALASPASEETMENILCDSPPSCTRLAAELHELADDVSMVATEPFTPDPYSTPSVDYFTPSPQVPLQDKPPYFGHEFCGPSPGDLPSPPEPRQLHNAAVAAIQYTRSALPWVTRLVLQGLWRRSFVHVVSPSML